MSVFKILERFNVTDRGTIYLIRKSPSALIRMGDLLYDLRGNRFSVKGFEMVRRIRTAASSNEFPLGLLLEPLDGVQAFGGLLLQAPFRLNFLFCSHPFYREQVDESYREEYQAAGLNHACALFSYEELEEGTLSLCGEELEGLTVYRGWMLKPELYRKLYEALEAKNIYLINSPEEYSRYHMLPGWYEAFAGETPKSVWTSGSRVEDVLELAKQLDGGACILKDYVKSRKHEWYDACFIPNSSNPDAVRRTAENFIRRQGEDLVGGVVLRKYEKLKRTGFHEKSGMPLSEEYRVFLYAGRILVMDDYWGKTPSGKLSEEELGWIASIANRVESNFVTLDVARKEDGSLIIMEFGDGQVSGLQQIPAERFYRSFDTCIFPV